MIAGSYDKNMFSVGNCRSVFRVHAHHSEGESGRPMSCPRLFCPCTGFLPRSQVCSGFLLFRPVLPCDICYCTHDLSVPFSFSYRPSTPTPPSCSPTEVIHVSKCVHPSGPFCFLILTCSNKSKHLLSICAQCIHPFITSAPAWLLSSSVRKLLDSMILNLLFPLKIGNILSPFCRWENWDTEWLSKWPVCFGQWGRTLVSNHVSWEEENGYMYVYGWVPLLSTWNCLHIVEWLCSSIK